MYQYLSIDLIFAPSAQENQMSSSKRHAQDPSEAEKGSPITSSSRAPGRKLDYFNYHPPFSILILEFLVWLFLLFVCFLNPNGGLAAVVKSDNEYIGILSKLNFVFFFLPYFIFDWLFVCLFLGMVRSGDDGTA